MSGNPVIKPFNPLDKRVLGQSVADALLEAKIHPLPPEPFIGAGICAIYYTGSFSAYERFSALNRDNQFGCPIYIGKAVPAGARKGGFGLDAEHGQAIFKRLSEHAGSIKAAQNINVDDFYSRFLVVDVIWMPLAESMLIERLNPVWNCALDGFGNHDPGKGRHQGKTPQWDCPRPGRVWASRLQPNENTPQKLAELVERYLAANI
jgi:hypothetical protein